MWFRSGTLLWRRSRFRSRFRSRARLRCWSRFGSWFGRRAWLLCGPGFRPRLFRMVLRMSRGWFGFRSGLHGVLRPLLWPCLIGVARTRLHGGTRLRLHRVCWMRAVIQDWPYHRSGCNSVVRCDWLGRGKRLGSSMVHRSELRAVCPRLLPQLQLSAHRRRVGCAIRRYLCGDRTELNSVRSTVIARPVVIVDRDIVYDRPVVNVGDVNVADVIDVAVVVEIVPVPVTALVASAGVSVAIVHATIEANVATPVAMVEAVSTANESPVRRRPQCAVVRRRDPYSRHPVISSRCPGPVSGRPDIARPWNRRLLIFRQLGRRLRSIILRLRVI